MQAEIRAFAHHMSDVSKAEGHVNGKYEELDTGALFNCLMQEIRMLSNSVVDVEHLLYHINDGVDEGLLQDYDSARLEVTANAATVANLAALVALRFGVGLREE